MVAGFAHACAVKYSLCPADSYVAHLVTRCVRALSASNFKLLRDFGNFKYSHIEGVTSSILVHKSAEDHGNQPCAQATSGLGLSDAERSGTECHDLEGPTNYLYRILMENMI